MNLRWIAISVLLFLPSIFFSSYFFHTSLATTGYPIGTFDVVNTHYKHELTGYAPLIQSMNYGVWWILSIFGGSVEIYNAYFTSLCITVSLWAPFILLWMITKKLEYPGFFLLGTAIWINIIVIGLISQAIVVNLMLLTIYRPRYTPLWLIIAFVAHDYGIFMILLAYCLNHYKKGVWRNA